MNATLQQMVEVGLEPLLVEAVDVIGQARFRHNTNDVVLSAVIEANGRCEIRSSKREDLLPILRENFPEAQNALRLLNTPLPPNRFLLITFDLRNEAAATIYSTALIIPGTLGVLN